MKSVKEARKRRIWILKLDWLEDSLLRTKPKRMEESKYSYEQMRIKKIKQSRKRATVKLDLASEANSDEIKGPGIDDKTAVQARKVEKAGKCWS